MSPTATRRAFLGDLSQGLLLAGLGPALLDGLGFRPAAALTGRDERLTFGALEPLVRLMQETPAEDIVAVAVAKLREGVDLKTLAGAAALANARTFGGEDYTGYHCAMAFAPAYDMAAQMKDPRLAALPLLRVIRRSAAQTGGSRKETLKALPEADGGDASSEALVAAERKLDARAAEACIAAAARSGPEKAFETLQPLVRENVDVHQVVLAWRSYDLRRLAGAEHAAALLRQSVRHCVASEGSRTHHGQPVPRLRSLLPALLDEHKLLAQVPPERALDDAALLSLAGSVFAGSRDDAARAVAAALASGARFADVAEAVSLASFRLVLHDPGRTRAEEGKPKGTVHGASVGVHASDSANAWRNIAAATSRPTAVATLIAAAWHTGGQSGHMAKDEPCHAAAREGAAQVPAEKLADAVREAVRGRDQKAAAALVERCGSLDLPVAPVIGTLLDFVVQDDGALHHEKFFRTACEHVAVARPAFRWPALTALARVCASGAGFASPGIDEARKLLLG